MKIDKKTLRNIFLGVIACIVVYWVLHEGERVSAIFSFIKSILAPFIIGACLAFILNVPMRAFEKLLKGVKKDGLRRLLAVVLTFISLLLVLALVFALLIPQLIDTINSLIPKLYTFVTNLETTAKAFLEDNPTVMNWLSSNTELTKMNWASIAEKAISVLGNSLTTIMSSAFSAIGSVYGAFMNAFIAIVFAVYCLFQKETLSRQCRRFIYAFLPEKLCDGIIRVLRLTNTTFSNFLSGQCIEVCILGSMFAIAMAIFGMPYIPLVSVLIAVTAFIPIVGAWIGCVCGAFLMLVANPMQAVWFVVMFLIIQQIENNMIYPRVVGTSIGLSGMWVLVAVAVGGELMGVAGMFLMIPFTSVLYTLLREWTNNRLATLDIDAEKLNAQPPEIASKMKLKRKPKTKASNDKENEELTQ